MSTTNAGHSLTTQSSSRHTGRRYFI